METVKKFFSIIAGLTYLYLVYLVIDWGLSAVNGSWENLGTGLFLFFAIGLFLSFINDVSEGYRRIGL